MNIDAPQLRAHTRTGFKQTIQIIFEKNKYCNGANMQPQSRQKIQIPFITFYFCTRMCVVYAIHLNIFSQVSVFVFATCVSYLKYLQMFNQKENMAKYGKKYEQPLQHRGWNLLSTW